MLKLRDRPGTRLLAILKKNPFYHLQPAVPNRDISEKMAESIGPLLINFGTSHLAQRGPSSILIHMPVENSSFILNFHATRHLATTDVITDHQSIA